MRVRAIVSFSTIRGIVPAGAVFTISDNLIGSLQDKVEVLPLPCPEQPQTPDPILSPAPEMTVPPTGAYITESGEFRCLGIIPGEWPDGGLTAEIVRLTSQDMPLQRRLLCRHVGCYSMPGALAVLKAAWAKRIEQLISLSGLDESAAQEIAASELALSSFLAEWLGGDDNE